jgi:uncharacterized protein with HEPN domain
LNYDIRLKGQVPGTNLSDEFRQRYSEVPWEQIIGLRNRIVHAYFDVNLQIVWEVVQNDLSPLKRRVERMLEEVNKSV